MVRTQIYLTEDEREALRAIGRQSGKKQSELIRQAVDGFIAQHRPKERQTRLQQARGMWQGRDDLPDFRSLRQEFDR